MNSQHRRVRLMFLFFGYIGTGLILTSFVASIGPYLAAVATASTTLCFANGIDNYGNPIPPIIVNCPTPPFPTSGIVMLFFGIFFVGCCLSGRYVIPTERRLDESYEHEPCPRDEPPYEPEFESNNEREEPSTNALRAANASTRLRVCNAHNSVMSYDTEEQTYFCPRCRNVN